MTGVPFSANYYKILPKWANGAVNHQMPILFEMMTRHPILLCTATTGAGKSTQIPKQALEYFGWRKSFAYAAMH
jgi:HrpA-like RNA helicase